MLHTLIHIYGPFSIHSFGLLLGLGILLTMHLALKHPLRKKIISSNHFIDAIIVTILTGLAGSRILFLAQNWQSFDHWTEFFTLWSGGLSLLGGIIAILVVVPLYLRYYAIPLLSFFDLIAIHAPLLQAIARLGCFLAGCCFGAPATLPWSITYTDPESAAPLCTSLHPAQLYSAVALLSIFLCIYLFFQYRFKKPGQILALYLFLVSIERFSVDFFRGDREFSTANPTALLSTHQLITIGIASVAIFLFIYVSFLNPQSTHRT